MKRVYKSVVEMIGNTPLLELKKIKKEYNLQGNIYAKIESFNPAGSIKDRVALSMINQARKQVIIKERATIIEPTSGNTGIGIAMLSASMGYKAVIVMPDTMSVERIKLIKAYGAQVVLTDGKLGMRGAIDKANEIQQNTPNSFIPSQFDNPANPQVHYETTAREIVSDLEGDFSYFVAGIGTGGTLCGSAKYFKEQNFDVKIIGVEPEGSPLITKGISGSHKLQGIGANFIPKNYNGEYVDEVIAVSDEDAYKMAREMATKEGLLVGISSGAALKVATILAKKEENNGKNIVVIFPDTGDRYLSTDLFDE